MKNSIICDDILNVKFENDSIDCLVTSPPYYNLRNYSNNNKEIGREESIDEYINNLVNVFIHLRNSVKGTMFINIGDVYINKCLQLIPERFAFEMMKNRFILKNKLIWYKSNPFTGSPKTRFKNTYENIFMFTRDEKYHFNPLYVPYKSNPESWNIYNYKQLDSGQHVPGDMSKKGKFNPLGKLMSDVWEFGTSAKSVGHFAAYPEKLVENCINSSCPENGTVIDPFAGSGTTGSVAKRLNKNYIMVDISEEYCEIMHNNLNDSYI